MQLRVARLCLDCEEIHDQQGCPVCSSESFAYITRWIPRPESAPRQRPAPSRETTDAYRELINPTPPVSGVRRWARRGAFALGAVGLASWALRQKGSADGPPTEAAKKNEGRP